MGDGGGPHVGRGPIISRTPLRVSFAGGGTDLPAFFDAEDGAVLSTAIDSYVYVTVKPHSELFFEPIRINYSVSEQVESVSEIQNNIARACLELLEIEPPIYISVVGDVPASTGLGGSSAFAVGLLNALHALQGKRVSPGQLAEEACHVEIDVLGEPIGKQDQYAAAYGGMNLFTFRSGGQVTAQHQRVWRNHLDPLFDSMMMFWTGHQRDASGVLEEQRRNTGDKMQYLGRMRDLALHLHELVDRHPVDVGEFGRTLDEGWQLKRDLASGITNPFIDDAYDKAMAAGAHGGKLCGAGGGGFLLFIVPPDRQDAVRAAMDMPQHPMRHEAHGSTLVTPFPGMRFHELPLAGAYTIDLERIEDDRGFNARAWCAHEMRDAGLPTDLAQINVIHNHVAGTVRGFHYQWPPHGEAKLFRVTAGAIHDVIVDLRPESPTFGQHHAVELRAEDHRMLFVPARFGQAFQTLRDDTHLTYQVTEFYTPDAGDGFRWDDPAIGVDWPLEPASISAKDAGWPDLDLDLVARRMRGD